VAELESDVLELEQLLILLDDGILRLGQNLDQRGAVQIFQYRAHRQAADEFRYETELDEVDRLCLRQQIDITPSADTRIADAALLLFLQKAHRLLAGTARNHLFQAHECPAANEQDVGRVHRREFLVRMLAAALRRNVGYRAFQDLEKRLLHAFARDVARDRGVLVLTPDLIDFV